ncbi:hypothetical protein MMIN_27880 [Mycolicibacter minnesotensis]|nr:hypothetical protein MMIN_27880 [Mycolicibacter minnesotensis]
MNGASAVTLADTNRVGSISHRDPVAVLESGIGRNALGNTNALIAAVTADRSERRWGLKPAPMESMPMMIWLIR